MGMDLKPVSPKMKYHPKEDDGSPQWGRYNWSGWRDLMNLLNDWGVSLDDVAGDNGGNHISFKTCKAIAQAIKDNLNTLSAEDREWLEPHIKRWKYCGGYRQY